MTKANTGVAIAKRTMAEPMSVYINGVLIPKDRIASQEIKSSIDGEPDTLHLELIIDKFIEKEDD